MKQKINARAVWGTVLLAVFALYTVSLTFVDKRPIGPGGSMVAYATLNGAAHRFFGVNMTWYSITDWAGVVAIAIAFGFAIVGLVQWIRRRHLLKVDSQILLLGVFYIVVFGVYVMFEYIVINHRPVLINGFLEASYPSSTTMLATCVLPTAMMQFRRLLHRRRVKIAVNTACALFTALMVVGRLLSGVHWLTDIVGALLFSVAVILLYCAAAAACEEKSRKI